MDGPRAPRREELDPLLDLLCAIWPHFTTRYTQQELHSSIRKRVHRRDTRIIAEDGRVVSNIQMMYNHVSVYGCRLKVASIGGVCTREDRRKRGLAGAILEHCLEEMTARGARLLYVSGDRNLYRRNYCVNVGGFFEVGLSGESLGPVKSSPAARCVSAEDWPAVAPLHQAEPVRFVRRADFLSRTCFWWDELHPEIWLIEQKDHPLAYLVLSPPWGADPGDTTRTVLEYGGARAALLDALPSICEARGISRVDFSIPARDRDLLRPLGARGAALKPAVLAGHTVRVLNLPGLMRDLRPHLAALLPRADLRRLSFDQRGTTCLLRCGDEEVQLDLGQAAQVVFGGPKAPVIPGDLGRVLSQVFPAPIPHPGLSRI